MAKKRRTRTGPAGIGIDKVEPVKQEPKKVETKKVEPTGSDGVDVPSGPGKPINYATSEWAPANCPKCGSTEREPFKGRTTVVDCAESVHKMLGVVYNRVIFRPTRCLNCGQMIRTKEFRFVTSKDDGDDGES